VIDTSKGTVHMVIGGGGTSVPSNQLFFNPPQCRVITAVGKPDSTTGKPVYVKERAPWSAVRNAAHSYDFAAFTVGPGSDRGGITTTRSHIMTSQGRMVSWPRSKLYAAPPPRLDRQRSKLSCWQPVCTTDGTFEGTFRIDGGGLFGAEARHFPARLEVELRST
jgi:hypothetical protein